MDTVRTVKHEQIQTRYNNFNTHQYATKYSLKKEKHMLAHLPRGIKCNKYWFNMYCIVYTIITTSLQWHWSIWKNALRTEEHEKIQTRHIINMPQNTFTNTIQIKKTVWIKRTPHVRSEHTFEYTKVNRNCANTLHWPPKQWLQKYTAKLTILNTTPIIPTNMRKRVWKVHFNDWFIHNIPMPKPDSMPWSPPDPALIPPDPCPVHHPDSTYLHYGHKLLLILHRLGTRL